MSFPSGFLWGAATSAYQIEGAAEEDGRGPSVWDDFCHAPPVAGAVWQGDTGDVACDHYHRFRDDVALMARLGLRAYRLSISWSRVLPDGVGRANPKGLGFYDALVDELLGAGIEPWITLFHWDYPLALQRRGGWMNRDSAAWFAEYATIVAGRLSDRVSAWITINEPQCFVRFGHGDGSNAPGLKLSLRDQLRAAHNVLLAHGRGVTAIRAAARRTARVGWAPVGLHKVPASASTQDMDAAQRATFSVTTRDVWNTSWFNDPVFLGRYPEDGVALFGADGPQVLAGDMDVIRQPLDFLGLNIYEAPVVRSGRDGTPEAVARVPGYATTACRWAVEPESLYWGPRFHHERYRVPIYITENGLSNVDWVSMDGAVHDPQRIDFCRRYLLALRRAAHDGVDVRGYFHWSLLDNFEWSHGYKERFGLVFVDFPTQRRIPKDSAAWFREVVDSNGASLDRHRGEASR